MKICIVVPHFAPYVGGGEKLFLDITKGLVERGHEVRVVTSTVSGLLGHHPYEGVDVWYCDWRSFFGHPLVVAKDLEEHVRWADLVHTTLFTTAPQARKIARKYNKPCVLTVYEVLGKKWFWVVDSPILALMFRVYEYLLCRQKFSTYHTISDATKNDYERYIGQRNHMTRIYCSVEEPQIEEIAKESIDIHQYFDLDKEDVSFLYFGRPAPNKGIFVLEQAIELLHEEKKIPENIKFCMLLAKEPADKRKKLIETIEQKQLGKYVSIKESVSRNELNKLIYDADYVIIPSIAEGFGLSAAEACSMGKHVIYSSGGSLPEVVSGKCLQFENRNANDLAEKLFSVMKQGDSAFGTQPRKVFDKDRMNNEIVELYENCLRNYGND